MAMSVQHLFIYPVKSLGGIELASSAITRRGLKYDRRFMLVDDQGNFLTQRVMHKLALFRTAIKNDILEISFDRDKVEVPLEPAGKETIPVTVWSYPCEAIVASDDVNRFFSDRLNSNVRLVYMPETFERRVDERYAKKQAITSFTDGYPILLIGSASLDDLNSRMEEALGWDRFRPSIVVKTNAPFEEDHWREFRIGDSVLEGVKLCSRCVLTTIDQSTGEGGKEPLRTLASYRIMDNQVMFGQNVLVLEPGGNINVGDVIRLSGDQ